MVEKTADAARSAAQNPTAFATISNLVGENIYKNPNDPYIKYVSATDVVAKSVAFQELYRGLVNQAAPQGSKAGNMFDYLQTLLRSSGLSKGKSPIGVIDSSDTSALDKALSSAIAMNSDVFSYLNVLSATGGGAGAVKQIDTTPKYNKQVSTALQMKDATDAKAALADAYFTSWGTFPTEDLITKFGNAWNAQQQKQAAVSTTDTTTTFEKVINPKTGKQMVDKSGVLQYKTTNAMKTTTTSEGFTQKEQEAFLADYISKNFPEANIKPGTLGGAAKSIYDDIVATYKSNYQEPPTLDKIMPIVQQMIGTSDANVGKTILDKAKGDIRKATAAKYMGIADYVNAGEDANKYIDPLIKTASEFLEKPLTANDDFIKMALNYQGPDGKYRLMNDYELTQALMKHPDYAKTSKAKNEGINAIQALASKLGR